MLFVDFIVLNGPQASPKVLSSVPKCKKSIMCLTEKIHVLDKLSAGLSYSAVGCAFSVNESTIQYIQKKDKIR